MKFIADVMLGKLAKYLRICGYDISYYKDMDDASLIDKALREDRMLLTRDKRMLERKEIRDDRIKYAYIESKAIKSQLDQMKDAHNLKLTPNLLRCIKCNRLLKPILKDEAKDHVPRYVFETQENFFYCSGCGKFYWSGTHKKNMEKFFKENLYD